MPVFHFTLRAYRTWPADHPDGYHRRGIQGALPPDSVVARRWDTHAHNTPATFDRPSARRIIRTAQTLASERQWRLHGIIVMPEHVHAVLSWDKAEVLAQIKQYLKGRISRELSAMGLHLAGRKFSRGTAARRIRNRMHLRYVLDEYLPGHSGEFWREGMIEPVTL